MSATPAEIVASAKRFAEDNHLPHCGNGSEPEAAPAISILERLRTVAFDVDNPPPDEPVTMSVAGVEVCHPGSITVIEAHQKVGKSAFVSAGLASILACADADFLGWRSDSNPHGFGVLHFDSEQSRGDHDKLIRRALARAALDKPPAWFQSFCFTGWSVAEMHGAVSAAMADAVARFDGVHSVWLDGLGDLVQSPNDEQESFAFVRWLQSQAIAHACPIIGVLHLNPGDSGKSRGHLGSDLNRKAETVLRLTRDGDVTTVTTPHPRRAPIPANDAPRFAWSGEHGRHVSVTTASAAKQQTEEESARRMIAAVWQDNREAVRKYEDILREIMRYTRKSESDAKRKFGFSQQLNLVQKGLGGIGYILTEKGSALP